jgi:hypothetical protein
MDGNNDQGSRTEYIMSNLTLVGKYGQVDEIS